MFFSVWNSRLEMFFQLLKPSFHYFLPCVYMLLSQLSVKVIFFFSPAAFKIFLYVFGFLLFHYAVSRCRLHIDYIIDQKFQGHAGWFLGVGEGWEIGSDKGDV